MVSQDREFTKEEILDIVQDIATSGGYVNEEKQDKLIHEIKILCLLYLDDPSTIKYIDIDYINALDEFLISKYSELRTIRKKLDIPGYSWPLSEVAQSMDEFLLNNIKDAYVNESIRGKLAKDFGTALDTIRMCKGIIDRIKRDF